MTDSAPAYDNSRAAFWMVASMAAFAVEDVFLKRAAESMPPGEVLVLTGAVGAVVFGLAALLRGEQPFSLTALQGIVGLRSLCEAIGSFLYILVLAFAPLVFASSLMQATPLVTTAGAALFLGERVGWRRWLSIFVGFLGVLVILQPWQDGVDLSGLAMVGVVLVLAARDLMTRRMPASVGSMSLSAWAYCAMTLSGVILMPVIGQSYVLPDPLQATYLGVALVTGLLGYYAVVTAMRLGEVSAIAPLRYSRLVFATILAMLLLGEGLQLHVILGSIIVVASGLYVFARERKRRAALSPR